MQKENKEHLDQISQIIKNLQKEKFELQAQISQDKNMMNNIQVCITDYLKGIKEISWRKSTGEK